MFLRNKRVTSDKLQVTRNCLSNQAGLPIAYRLTLNASGFTLIEVLVAIVILATGLVLVIEGMARTQQAIRISENLMQVSFLAEEKSAEIELKVINVKKIGLSHNRENIRLNGREFAIDENISPYSDASMKDQTRLNQADIGIFWQESPSRSNEFVLSSLVRNRDKKKTALGQVSR